MKTRKSVMKHQFSQVPRAEIPRSSFDRSHGYKTTFDAGLLIPVFVDEVLPGDTFNLRMTGFARLATPIFPIMDNMYLDTHFFFVPNRLLWNNWERFNGAQDDPDSLTDFVIPRITQQSHLIGSIGDYFGLPTQAVVTPPTSALPFRAYNLIFREWFRDQNLQDSPTVLLDDGPDAAGAYALFRRGKRHDYFTSCLPFPQKGDAVDLPLGVQAPIFTDSVDNEEIVIGEALVGFQPDAHTFMDTAGAAQSPVRTSALNKPGGTYPANVTLYADLTQATAATINQLRQAFQIQKLLERDARGGTRYTEIVRAHFGVTSPDARLQRPEYLGGGSTPVIISPVAQTSETLITDGASPQGNLAAFGTASLNNHGFTKSFTEHGIIIGLVSCRADLTYQQGLDRFWSRESRFDFYWPALSHIGEQAVLNQEIFLSSGEDDTSVFGYQERFAEYRYKPSKITGLFRSDAAGSLDAWHLSQDFETLPALDSDFIEENPPLDRVIAVTDEPHFLFDSYFQLRCARPMPMYGVPGFVDHF